ncbi:hypothetical protein BU16DRAFT_568261 [Lophium mytilinum]|uniref:Transmembrane protein n=1 Tax=Lophium mytilinum TaxID=390894 RepID=A0A6A6Q8H7_9PEZI|nr:hypothetical protein BU16DRAFT_568261 [Lophium mytilinum]
MDDALFVDNGIAARRPITFTRAERKIFFGGIFVSGAAGVFFFCWCKLGNVRSDAGVHLEPRSQPLSHRRMKSTSRLVLDFVPEAVYRASRYFNKRKTVMRHPRVKLYICALFRSLTYIHSQVSAPERSTAPPDDFVSTS